MVVWWGVVGGVLVRVRVSLRGLWGGKGLGGEKGVGMVGGGEEVDDKERGGFGVGEEGENG